MLSQIIVANKCNRCYCISMSDILSVKNKEPVIDSRELAKGFDIEHRSVRRLIDTYIDAFKRMGFGGFQIHRTKNGREEKFCYLNEKQSTFLVSLMKNSDVVVEFKEHLVNEFHKMKSILLQLSLNKKNQEWLTNREDGKLQRRETTDTIKRFIEYAMFQGSKNADRYYTNISQMENKALFLVQQKFPNLREVMNNRQLSFIKSADIIVLEAIEEGMREEMLYKDIFKLCKKRVMAFSELIPITQIPMMIEGEQ